MKSRKHISSDTLLGLGDYLVRPSTIPCPSDPCLVDLTVFMVERMSVARNLLDRDPKRAQRRLRTWWFDVGIYIQRSTAVDTVRKNLKDIDTDEVSAAITWFAGHWHDSRSLMVLLL